MTKILLVDDDVTALDLVDLLFEDQGFEVVRKTDGPAVIESIDKINPTIIMIDLRMPEMDGQECVRILRERGLQIPIIAFTAVDDPDVHDEAIEAGCNLVLTKPCKPKLLVHHVKELLAKFNS